MLQYNIPMSTDDIERRLDVAAQHCTARGARLSVSRRRVLRALLQAEHPLGAYAILERMAEDGARPLPPTVYRALDFLMAEGLAHKIHSANTYLACCEVGRPHAAEMFVCRRCGDAREVPRRGDAGPADVPAGFAVENVVMEVRGLCRACRDGA